MRERKEEVRELIKSSKGYRKYRRIVNTLRSNLDFVKLETEIKLQHSSRKSRFLDPAKVSPKTLIEANAVDIGSRGRLVQIKTDLYSHKVDLDVAMSAISEYAMVEWGSMLNLKTKYDKESYFGRFFRAGEELIAEINRLMEMCNEFVKDIDQAGFGLRNIQENLEMIYTKERSI